MKIITITVIILFVPMCLLAGDRSNPPILHEDFTSWPAADWEIGDGWVWNDWANGNAWNDNDDGWSSLITPQLTLLPEHQASLTLRIYQEWAWAWFEYYYDRLHVHISTDGGVNWTELAVIGHEHDDWYIDTVDLSGYYGDNCYVALTHDGGEAHGNHIDWVTINNNGPDPAFLDMAFDQVSFPSTHNSFCHTNDFSFPNQNRSITDQLDAGARALMLDLYNYNNEVICYHGDPILGSESLHSILVNDIRPFLDSHPYEIVTLILECYVDDPSVMSVFDSAGLSSRAYAHTAGQPWPTVREIIESGKQLVVLSDNTDGNGWYMKMWEHAVDTHYSNYGVYDFNNDFYRGDSENPLYIVNHFITDETLGIGVEDAAGYVNGNPFFLDRMLTAWRVMEKKPTYPTVDFFDIGNVRAGCDILNSISFEQVQEGLIAHFPLDENAVGTGIANWNGNTSEVSFIDDQQRSQVAQFSNSHIPIDEGGPSQFIMPIYEMTISCWVKPEQFVEWGGYVGNIRDTLDNEHGWVLGSRDNNFSFGLRTDGSSITYLTAPESASANQWYHLTGTYNGSNMKLFIDGNMVSETTAQSGLITYPDYCWFEIGSYRDDDELNNFTGCLDDIRLYNRALSADEISELVIPLSAVASLPVHYQLPANYPNPFNPSTTIRYAVPANGAHVTLNIYDTRGKLIANLVDETCEQGNKTATWNGTNLSGSKVASGVYLVKLGGDGFSGTRKIMLTK
ncbi:T9SS type A sorting domain-containing protein [bacterium]|nr:T9SS type A sorting domain-containing protein [bacterium]